MCQTSDHSGHGPASHRSASKSLPSQRFVPWWQNRVLDLSPWPHVAEHVDIKMRYQWLEILGYINLTFTPLRPSLTGSQIAGLSFHFRSLNLDDLNSNFWAIWKPLRNSMWLEEGAERHRLLFPHIHYFVCLLACEPMVSNIAWPFCQCLLTWQLLVEHSLLRALMPSSQVQEHWLHSDLKSDISSRLKRAELSVKCCNSIYLF